MAQISASEEAKIWTSAEVEANPKLFLEAVASYGDQTIALGKRHFIVKEVTTASKKDIDFLIAGGPIEE